MFKYWFQYNVNSVSQRASSLVSYEISQRTVIRLAPVHRLPATSIQIHRSPRKSSANFFQLSKAYKLCIFRSNSTQRLITREFPIVGTPKPSCGFVLRLTVFKSVNICLRNSNYREEPSTRAIRRIKAKNSQHH